MEQFEKWLLTDEGQILVGDYRAKAAWRAALELVFGWLDYSTEHEEIKDRIQKELGDT